MYKSVNVTVFHILIYMFLNMADKCNVYLTVNSKYRPGDSVSCDDDTTSPPPTTTITHTHTFEGSEVTLSSCSCVEHQTRRFPD